MTGCRSGKQTTNPDVTDEIKPSQMLIGPPLIIYKTKADYNNLVPVLLSDDKSEIISFPHPSDLKDGNALLTPTVLKDGYLLDNRGINENVAFLRYTYEEYSQMKTMPSINELYNNIVEKDPLTELCRCGLRTSYENPEKQINQLIEEEKLDTKCNKVVRK
ncbi:MAG: hypothetical protein LBQ22_02335 [Bacteroidales bacterium]|nr:hypothetical protein [Bacteroidales bacterium]